MANVCVCNMTTCKKNSVYTLLVIVVVAVCRGRERVEIKIVFTRIIRQKTTTTSIITVALKKVFSRSNFFFKSLSGI